MLWLIWLLKDFINKKSLLSTDLELGDFLKNYKKDFDVFINEELKKTSDEINKNNSETEKIPSKIEKQNNSPSLLAVEICNFIDNCKTPIDLSKWFNLKDWTQVLYIPWSQTLKIWENNYNINIWLWNDFFNKNLELNWIIISDTISKFKVSWIDTDIKNIDLKNWIMSALTDWKFHLEKSGKILNIQKV